jgi:hypothetical protein
VQRANHVVGELAQFLAVLGLSTQSRGDLVDSL